MVAAFSLATLLLFASAIAAKPVVERHQYLKLSLARRVNRNTSYSPIRHDRLRAKTLFTNVTAVVHESLQTRDSEITSLAENEKNTFYSATIGVGDPPTACKWLQHLVAD